jgi:hypothetical protein
LTAIYIHLDKSDPGFEAWNGEGAAVSDYVLELSAIADRLGIKPPDQYFSVMFQGDPDDPSTGMDDEGNPLPDNWFAPDEGLAWVRRMRTYIQEHRAELDDATGHLTTSSEVIDDLDRYEQVLLHAQASGANWQFWIDF